MAEWIYFIHPPREDFAATMTAEEEAVWGVHFERFERALAEGSLVLVGPTLGTKNTGIPFWEQDDLNKTVALYDKEGFQVLLHAIGDKAINMALNAFEYAAKTNGTQGRRHRVEHGEVPLLSDLPRFKQLGVIVSTQQLMARPDATELNNYAVLLGPERASHALAFKLYDDAGAVQAFGSDWTGFNMAPLLGIHVAVTRLTPEGTPKGAWYPQNRVSVPYIFFKQHVAPPHTNS